MQRTREVALRVKSSVNALVHDFLGRYVEARCRRIEALDQFEAVARSSHSASLEPRVIARTLLMRVFIDTNLWAYRLDRR